MSRDQDDIYCLLNEMRKLYVGQTGDITVNFAEGAHRKVHSAIACGCSPVFAAMLSGEWKENQQRTIDMTEVDVELGDNMFGFMYFREKEVPKTLEGKFKLFRLLDKYAILPYATYMKNCILHNIDSDSLLSIIKLANEYGYIGEAILTECANFIVKDIKDRGEIVCYNSSVVNTRYCCFHDHPTKRFPQSEQYCAYYTNHGLPMNPNADVSLCCLHDKKIKVLFSVEDINGLPTTVKDQILCNLLR